MLSRMNLDGISLVANKATFLVLISPTGRSYPLFRNSLESGISTQSKYKNEGPETQTPFGCRSAKVEVFLVGISAGFTIPGI